MPEFENDNNSFVSRSYSLTLPANLSSLVLLMQLSPINPHSFHCLTLLLCFAAVCLAQLVKTQRFEIQRR